MQIPGPGQTVYVLLLKEPEKGKEKNGILLPTVRKNCSSDREYFLKNSRLRLKAENLQKF